MTATISDIPINFANEELLQDRGLYLMDSNASKLSIKCSGRRSAIVELSKAELSATVDLEQVIAVGETGLYQLTYTINYPKNISLDSFKVVSSSVDYVSVNISKFITRSIEVRGTYDGGVAEGYAAAPMEINPEVISVSGPEEIVSRIDYAWVALERESLSKSVSEDVPYTLHNEEGVEIPKDDLVFDMETVNISITVTATKDIALSINPIYGAGATAENTVIEYSSDSVTVTGDAKLLADYNQFTLGTVDLSKITTSVFEATYPVNMPNGIENLSGITEVTVKITMVGLSTKKMSVSNIQVSNVTDGYVAEIITQSLDVTIRADSRDIDSIKSANVTIVADLSEIDQAVGTYTVPAKIYLHGVEGAGAVGEYRVTVKISH